MTVAAERLNQVAAFFFPFFVFGGGTATFAFGAG